MAEYWGDDSWDLPRGRRPVGYEVREREWLAPVPQTRTRARSQGQSPAPTFNIYNRVVQDNNEQATPYPPVIAYPPGAYPPPAAPSPRITPRASPERRPRKNFGDMIEEHLAGDVADMALEHRYNHRRFASHSRGPSETRQPDKADTTAAANAALAEYRIAQMDREMKEMERKQEWEKRESDRKREWELNEERIRNQIKLDDLQAQMKRERDAELLKDREKQYLEKYQRKEREDKDRAASLERSALENYQRKQREEKERAAELERRTLEEYQRKQREAKEKEKAEEERVREKIEREKREKKEAEDRAYREFKEKERAAKEEKERQYNEFLREQKEKEDKRKKEEKEKEEDFQSEMRKRLASLGYTEETIELMVDKEKSKKFKETVERKTEVDVFQARRSPVYPKIHRDYLAIETLQYFDLPWEYDSANPDYIIILRDMDRRETDVLFEHTTRLRTKLLLEPAPKKDPQYAWVRRRSRSRSGAKIGILEIRK